VHVSMSMSLRLTSASHLRSAQVLLRKLVTSEDSNSCLNLFRLDTFRAVLLRAGASEPVENRLESFNARKD